MKVYSSTLFLNEFHLLDLKKQESDVDEFIVIEADKTHAGNPKECYLEDSIKVTDFGDDPWENEAKQRNGFDIDFKDDDIILISDTDEILNKEEFPRAIDLTREHGFIRLNFYCCMYKINLLIDLHRSWYCPLMVTGKYYKEYKKKTCFINGEYEKIIPSSFDTLRKFGDGKIIDFNGWHFGYLNTAENISYKLQNFSHTEVATEKNLDVNRIKQRMALGIDVLERQTSSGALARLNLISINEQYPKTILNNLDKWKEWIATTEEDE